MKKAGAGRARKILLHGCVLLLLLWAALLAAPAFGKGSLALTLGELAGAFGRPFDIRPVPAAFGLFALFVLIYACVYFSYAAKADNERPREEHGSARWGDAGELRSRYAPDRSRCVILTENTGIGYDTRAHGRNLNILVCGGSGAGKSRTFAMPNILQCGEDNPVSLFVLDPKAELLRATGGYLERAGYKVRVLDLISMDRSVPYNPFVYLRGENDVQKLVTNIFKNTSGEKGRPCTDPFWEQTSMMLLMALVLYVRTECSPENRNFPRLLDLLRLGEVREGDDSFRSELDKLFDALAEKDPGHTALKYYRNYRSGSAKTLKSIQLTLCSRLEKYNLSELADISRDDGMDLWSMGREKTAVFAVIPDSDTSFNFLVGMLYTQLFQVLYEEADSSPSGRLEVPVLLIMDEFANVSVPESFDRLISTMRSRGISVSILIQNMAQLKKLFEKDWESIVGNCDGFLYLGGNEFSTHEYVSKLIGSETVSKRSVTVTRGAKGSTNENISSVGRNLVTPDEVRMLDGGEAIVFIRGERPVKDRKYDVRKHPNYRYTSMGGAEQYVPVKREKAEGTGSGKKKDGKEYPGDRAFEIRPGQTDEEEEKKAAAIAGAKAALGADAKRAGEQLTMMGFEIPKKGREENKLAEGKSFVDLRREKRKEMREEYKIKKEHRSAPAEEKEEREKDSER